MYSYTALGFVSNKGLNSAQQETLIVCTCGPYQIVAIEKNMVAIVPKTQKNQGYAV